MRRNPNRIYVAECGDMVKIGVSIDPEARVRAFACDYGRTAILVWKSDPLVYARSVEWAAHKALHAHRVSTEWFRVPAATAIAVILDIPDEPRGKQAPIASGRAQKTCTVGFKWRPETRAALQKASRAEGRSLSDLAERIVAEWLARNSANKRRDGE